MIWKPLTYKTGKKSEERDEQCKHTLQSSCGKFRISRDKLDGTGRYTLWQLNARHYLYCDGNQRWCCIAEPFDSADDAKRAALDHRR